MKRVIVIGSPGAGKSTFSRRLRQKTGLPLYYLDQIWHRPDKTNVSREEFDRRLGEILEKDCWIIDGNYLRTLQKRMEACDGIFFLDYPVKLCLESVQARIGKKREDMPWVETELDEEFREWILRFPKDQRPKILSLLAQYGEEKEIHVFSSRREANDYLDQIFLHPG